MFMWEGDYYIYTCACTERGTRDTHLQKDNRAPLLCDPPGSFGVAGLRGIARAPFFSRHAERGAIPLPHSCWEEGAAAVTPDRAAVTE